MLWMFLDWYVISEDFKAKFTKGSSTLITWVMHLLIIIQHNIGFHIYF